MSDVARVAAGQPSKSIAYTRNKANAELNAPYESEAVVTDATHATHLPPSSSSSTAWRRPQTVTVGAYNDPTAAGEPAMATRDHRSHDAGLAITASSFGSIGAQTVTAGPAGPIAPNAAAASSSLAPSSSAVTRARPSPSSSARAPAEGPSINSAGVPGHYTDPFATNVLSAASPPSTHAVATRRDSALPTLRAGASSSSASANVLQTGEGSSLSTSSPLATSVTPTRSTATSNNNNHRVRIVHSSIGSGGGGGCATVTMTSPPANAATSTFVPPTNGLPAARDFTKMPPLSSGTNSVTAAGAGNADPAVAVELPAGYTRSNFSNGAVPPPPLQFCASSTAAAAAGGGVPLPPTSAAPPPYAPPVNITANNNGSSSSGAGTSTEKLKDEKAADPYVRPAVALSAHLLEVYKMVNAQYCAQRRLESPGPKYNNGYDDKDGHYLFFPGEVIFQRYIAQEVLGKGSFGTVIRGFDQKRSEAVAMKITRRGSSFRSQAKLELDILLRLNENPALNHLVVRLLKVFEWQGHLVLVFELLSFNLYQLIKCTRFNGVSLDLVRKFAYQLTHTLLQLESQKPHPIIHCDLKPENVLLRNQNRSGIRLIDFGSACYTAKRFHRYIQSRFYRSPEVILFLEYGTAIDRWSLACVLVELHTGVPLFDGRTEAAQLAKFECTLGPIPLEMIAASPKASRFYHGSVATGFQLKEPIPERRPLESVIGVTTGGPRGRRLDTPGHDEKSYREFYDFIARFLRYQPEERMSCRDALQHPFLMPLYTSDLLQQQQRETHNRQKSTPQQQQQQQSSSAQQQTSHPQPQPTSTPSSLSPQTTTVPSLTVSRSAANESGPSAQILTAEEMSGSTGGGFAHSHA